MLKDQWNNLYVKDFDISLNKATFSCTNDNGILASTLYDLETADFKPNPSGYKPNFYARIEKNVGHIKYDDGCPKSIAYTYEDTIYLCRQFFIDNRISRASTLVHEMRHTQKDAPVHVSCDGGKYPEKLACDQDFFDAHWEGSGYNADIFYLAWTLKRGMNNELSKSIIQSEINWIIPDRFNNITDKMIKKWRRK